MTPRQQLIAAIAALDAGHYADAARLARSASFALTKQALGGIQGVEAGAAGLAEVIGRWPGDETDAEVAKALGESS